MHRVMRAAGTIAVTGIWVNASEFFRNEVLLKSYWTNHYQALGLVFPAEPINGMVWGVWGFAFSAAIYWATRRQKLAEAALLCWVMTFVLMWLVIGNLGVLPAGLLFYAVPLSLLEVFVGAAICRKLSPCATC
ncbi:MAG: hypothetical protein AB1400_01355 [Pseudomonadota bacterium]